MTEFKVGDKVRVNDRFGGSHTLIGAEGVIKYATHTGSLFDWFVDTDARELDLAVHSHEIDLIKADPPKKGDWVRVVKYRGSPEHTRVGWEGEVVIVTSTEVNLKFPHAGAENALLNTRYGWFLLDEVEVIENPDPQPLAQKDDQDLREAVGLLPGLDVSALTWDDETDPVEFLLEYGQALAGQLKYYKKKEVKLEKISEALEVLYDA